VLYVERDRECCVGGEIRAVGCRSSRGVEKTVMRFFTIGTAHKIILGLPNLIEDGLGWACGMYGE